MAKIQIKSKIIAPFESFFSTMETFKLQIRSEISKVLCIRYNSTNYHHSKIICTLICMYSCGVSKGL